MNPSRKPGSGLGELALETGALHPSPHKLVSRPVCALLTRRHELPGWRRHCEFTKSCREVMGGAGPGEDAVACLAGPHCWVPWPAGWPASDVWLWTPGPGQQAPQRSVPTKDCEEDWGLKGPVRLRHLCPPDLAWPILQVALLWFFRCFIVPLHL